jgi:hypothetical protein
VSDAYVPIAGQATGWSTRFRSNTALILIAFAIVALGASLWRSRRAWILVMGISAAAATVLVIYRAAQFPVRGFSGAIRVQMDNLHQRDLWEYRSALLAMRAAHRINDVSAGVQPIFASRRHFEGATVWLECMSDGTPYKFHYSLGRGQVLAFLSRTVVAGESSADTFSSQANWPLLPLVERQYLSPGDRIIGTRPVAPSTAIEAPEFWPEIVIEREAMHQRTPTPPPATAPATRTR